jgi:hypothetical protein
VQVPCHCRFINAAILEKLIPAYVNWHNDLLYKDKHHPQADTLSGSAGTLAALLTKIRSENE